MMRNLSKAINFFFLMLFLVGCKTLGNADKSNNTNQILETSEIDILLEQRYESAFKSYKIALGEALKWSTDAYLLEIPSTKVVSDNVSLISFGPYWFYIFGTESSAREFYIAIKNGKPAGSFQAQPIVRENMPFTKGILDIDAYIDSDEALKLCSKYNMLNVNEILQNNQELDYRLVNIDGNAVWSIFLIDSDPFSPICNIDAISGESTDDPFIYYQNGQ